MERRCQCLCQAWRFDLGPKEEKMSLETGNNIPDRVRRMGIQDNSSYANEKYFTLNYVAVSSGLAWRCWKRGGLYFGLEAVHVDFIMYFFAGGCEGMRRRWGMSCWGEGRHCFWQKFKGLPRDLVGTLETFFMLLLCFSRHHDTRFQWLLSSRSRNESYQLLSLARSKLARAFSIDHHCSWTRLRPRIRSQSSASNDWAHCLHLHKYLGHLHRDSVPTLRNASEITSIEI